MLPQQTSDKSMIHKISTHGEDYIMPRFHVEWIHPEPEELEEELSEKL